MPIKLFHTCHPRFTDRRSRQIELNPVRIRGIAVIGIYVSDLKAAKRFYVDIEYSPNYAVCMIADLDGNIIELAGKH
jgi:hypothetical protein